MTGSVKDFAEKATDSESQYLVLRSLWITYPLGLKKAHETFSLAVTLGDHLHPKQGHRGISILLSTHITI